MGPFPSLPTLCAALLFALAGAAPAAHAETLRLCYEPIDVPPWRYANGSGLNYELLTRVAKRIDVQLELQPLPWKRCIEYLKSNLVHGAIAMSFKPDRLAFGVYPGMPPLGAASAPDPAYRISNDRYVLVRRKGSQLDWDGRNFTHLNGAIGSQIGYSIASQLREMGVTVDDGSQKLGELMMKLAAGRLAGAAVLGSSVSILANKDPRLAAQVEVLPTPLVEKSYYLVLSHGFAASRPELATRLYKAIEAVRKSPEYRKLEEGAMAAGTSRPAGPPG
jgi:polar amino acid transport system substrate-binding protein